MWEYAAPLMPERLQLILMLFLSALPWYLAGHLLGRRIVKVILGPR